MYLPTESWQQENHFLTYHQKYYGKMKMDSRSITWIESLWKKNTVFIARQKLDLEIQVCADENKIRPWRKKPLIYGYMIQKGKLTMNHQSFMADPPMLFKFNSKGIRNSLNITSFFKHESTIKNNLWLNKINLIWSSS